MKKYVLDFNGTIGDFIKFWRKSKKINSIALSKAVGKSDAYISHIENGRNKKPDYNTLYEVFKQIGISEEKIEDYLEFFGFLSAERQAHEEQLMISRMEPTEEDLDRWENQASDFEENNRNEREEYLARQNDNKFNGDDLFEDILSANIQEINHVLNTLEKHDISNAFELIKGLSSTLNEMSTNITLYRFIIKLFSERLTMLDEEAAIKIINSLYEELNRIDREKTAFGKPRQRKLIKNLKGE
ncbi:helix-turn-helix domain-containing protein [Sutcliffiella horikoshii]|uniref:helix-turn-helix domain-containing protein n=1 Tax=Sutcliffiella horikoshii TaxID=79883 RepID=UPI003CEB28F9